MQIWPSIACEQTGNQENEKNGKQKMHLALPAQYI
jgi:hypothetical protein